MKYLLTLALFTISLSSFSQKKDIVTSNDNRSVVPIRLHEIHGYIDGLRLDSINSLFATFDFSSKQSITFDYGQNRIDKKPYVVTDSIGKPLQFNNSSLAVILNFFHFNHWDYVSNYQTSATQYGNTSFPVLKKW